MQIRRRDCFQNINRLHQDTAAWSIRPKRKNAVALLRTKQHVQHAADDRMIPCQKADIFTGERPATISCGRKPFLWQGRDLIFEKVASAQTERAVAKLFNPDAKVIKDFDQEPV